MLENVKKDGGDYKFSPEEIKELKKCLYDKIYFFEKYVKVKNPHHGLVPVKLKRSQVKIHDKHEQNNKTICVAPRQTGSSTYFMLEIIHNLLFCSNKTMVIASYNLNSSKSIISEIHDMVMKLPKCFSCLINKSNKTFIGTSIGSRLLTMPIDREFCRGFAVSHLYFDNVSNLSKKKLDELYDMIGPFLNFDMLTVRFVDSGAFDYFHKMWKFLELKDFIKFKIEVNDDERFDDESYSLNLRELIGDEHYIQEYEQHWTFK